MAKMCFSLVFGLMVTLYTVSSSVLPDSDGEMLFGSYESLIAQSTEDTEDTEVRMPESCQGKSYCFEKGPKYPEEKIAEVLKSLRNWKLENGFPSSEFGNRDGNGQDQRDCPEEYSNDPIYYIKDTNNETRVVLQLKDKFEQTYTVRWCLKPGPIEEDTPHFLKGSAILNNYKVECVDAKMDFDFFVLRDDVDPETGKPSPKVEVAKAFGGIPVCCKCRYDEKA